MHTASTSCLNDLNQSLSVRSHGRAKRPILGILGFSQLLGYCKRRLLGPQAAVFAFAEIVSRSGTTQISESYSILETRWRVWD